MYILVTAMTAVTLAGCGSSNNAAGDPASNDAAKTTESTEESVTEVESTAETEVVDGEEFSLYGAGIQPSMYMQ